MDGIQSAVINDHRPGKQMAYSQLSSKLGGNYTSGDETMEFRTVGRKNRVSQHGVGRVSFGGNISNIARI